MMFTKRQLFDFHRTYHTQGMKDNSCVFCVKVFA